MGGQMGQGVPQPRQLSEAEQEAAIAEKVCARDLQQRVEGMGSVHVLCLSPISGDVGLFQTILHLASMGTMTGSRQGCGGHGCAVIRSRHMLWAKQQSIVAALCFAGPQVAAAQRKAVFGQAQVWRECAGRVAVSFMLCSLLYSS